MKTAAEKNYVSAAVSLSYDTILLENRRRKS